MNNRECVVAVLARHREARAWDDEAVAADILGQLGIDARADAPAQPEASPVEVAVPEAPAALFTQTEAAGAPIGLPVPKDAV